MAVLDAVFVKAILAECDVAWTVPGYGFDASSGLMLRGEALATGTIDVPAAGKVAWTAHAELAEAPAIILADERYDR